MALNLGLEVQIALEQAKCHTEFTAGKVCEACRNFL